MLELATPHGPARATCGPGAGAGVGAPDLVLATEGANTAAPTTGYPSR